MNTEKSLEIAVLAGQLLMANGAETYRVEETMAHILSVYYPDNYGVYATPTGIFASIIPPDGHPMTLIKSVRARSTNLYAIDRINHLSREFEAGTITLELLCESMEEMRNQPETFPYSTFKKIIISGLTPFFMVLLVCGSMVDSFFALLIGFGMGYLARFRRVATQGVLVRNVVMSFFPSFFANFLATIGLISDASVVGIACLMLLVPGVAITNSIRDIIAGDYLSGAARALEAVLVAVAIAIGSGFGLAVAQGLGGWM